MRELRRGFRLFALFFGFSASMRTLPHTPSSGGMASPFAIYEAKAILRNQISPIEPGKRAANLLLRVADFARKLCMSVGRDRIAHDDDAHHILRNLRGRQAPRAINAIYQEVVAFMNF